MCLLLAGYLRFSTVAFRGRSKIAKWKDTWRLMRRDALWPELQEDRGRTVPVFDSIRWILVPFSLTFEEIRVFDRV